MLPKHTPRTLAGGHLRNRCRRVATLEHGGHSGTLTSTAPGKCSSTARQKGKSSKPLQNLTTKWPLSGRTFSDASPQRTEIILTLGKNGQHIFSYGEHPPYKELPR